MQMVIVSTLMALFSVSVKMAIAEMACSVQVMHGDLAMFDDYRLGLAHPENLTTKLFLKVHHPYRTVNLY